MSYMAALDPVIRQSGTRFEWSGTEEWGSEDSTVWRNIWSEALRTHAIKQMSQNTGTRIVYINLEGVPISSSHFETNAKELLGTIEVAFGRSPTNLASILRVSRPTIYHYRNGKEPSTENRRRLLALATLTSDWVSQIDRSLEPDLKTVQPEGKSLLDLLSDTELDFPAIRSAIHRSLKSRRRDRALRLQLADELSRDETIERRRDIILARHSLGKPIYIGDPDKPGKLIQMLPDGRRVRGHMVNRKFVPDEK